MKDINYTSGTPNQKEQFEKQYLTQIVSKTTENTKQKQEQQRINSDNQKPIINAFAKQDGSNAIISGRITDNIEIAEVLVDGQVQKLKSNGTFTSGNDARP